MVPSLVFASLVVMALAAVFFWARAKRRLGDTHTPASWIGYCDGAFRRLAASNLERLSSLERVVAEQPSAPPKSDNEDEQWTPPSKRHGSGKSWSDAVPWAAAGVDVGIPIADLWHRWSALDEHLFQAVRHLTHENVEGFGDLFHVVKDHFHGIGSDAFLHKLSGHLGEWHVQGHLMSAGHAVSMSAVSNFPGADMGIDGHAVDVKTWAHAGRAAAQHFGDYPDIPMIVPGDATGLPADAVHFDATHPLDSSILEHSNHLTLVDDALSHADVGEQAANATDILQDPGGLDIGVPVITLGVSAFREGRLLLKGDTDLGRAFKNVAVDGVAVGGGAAVGAKVGALAGAFLGPIGVAIGGVGGAVIGGIAGRQTANAVKRAPLEAAKASHEMAVANYKQMEKDASDEAGRAWELARKGRSDELREAARQLEQKHVSRLKQLAESIRNGTLLDRQEGRAELGACDQLILSRVRAEERALLVVRTGWHKYFPALFGVIEQKNLDALASEQKQWRERADSLLSSYRQTPEWTAACFDLILAVPGADVQPTSFLRQLNDLRKSAYSAAVTETERLKGHLIDLRRQAGENLKRDAERIRSDVETKLAPLVGALRSTAGGFRSELKKNGISVPA